ncbi:MAG: hypothetical protein KDK37_10880, partial [Leptospiraceae bacterium]|nr:hypothetical protein [Leptospiraceae bacterium]
MVRVSNHRRYFQSRCGIPIIALLFLSVVAHCSFAGKTPQLTGERIGTSDAALRYSIPPGKKDRFLQIDRTAYPRFAQLQCGDRDVALRPESAARPAFRLPESDQFCSIEIFFAQPGPNTTAHLSSPTEYHEEAMLRSQVLSVGMVGLTVLTFYLLSLSVALRNRIYVLFLLFSVTFLAYHIFRTGFYREWGLHIPNLASHLAQLMQLVYPGGLLLFVLEFRPAQTRHHFFHGMIVAGFLVGLIASIHHIPTAIASTIEILLLTAGLLSSFQSFRRKDGPGLIISNATLYFCTLAATLQNPAIPLHPAVENISLMGGLLHILGVSGVIGYRIHRLRRGELRARHRSNQTWQAALDSLEQTRQTKREFMSRMGKRLVPALEELQHQSRILLSQGSRASETPARRIIDESGRLIQLLVHSSAAAENKPEIVSLARLTEDSLTLAQLFPGPRQPRLINDVSADLYVQVDPDNYVRTLSEFLENLSFLESPEIVRIAAKIHDDAVQIRITSEGHAPLRNLDRNNGFDNLEKQANPERERAGRDRPLALIRRLSRDFLKQSLANLDSRARVSYSDHGLFFVSVPLAEAKEPETSDLPEEHPNGPYILLYSEDILYGHRLRARLAQMMPCIFYDQAPLNWKTPPAVVVFDVLDLQGSGPVAFIEELQRRTDSHPPVLVLSRSDDRSRFSELVGPALGDWITKPISIDLITDRIQSLLSMNQKLQEQKKRYHSLALQNRSQIRRSLHDSLGAQLTDLKILSEQLREGAGSRELGEEVDRTIRMLQDSLQDLEDSQALAADMMQALEDNIVRRYTRANRKIRREFEHRRLRLPPEVADDLFRVFQELVTNDLKYGMGTARWSLRTEESGVRLTMESKTEYDPSSNIPGIGTASI